MVTPAAHATSARVRDEIVSEELLAARIRCFESHEDFEDMDDGCIALLELEAALEAEERVS